MCWQMLGGWMEGPRALMWLWEQFPPQYLVALWLGQASEEENQCHPPWGTARENRLGPGGTFSTKLGWPGVTALELWLHQSLGGLGPGLGVPQGRKGLVPTVPRGSGREGLAGSARHLCCSPLGAPF